MHKIALLLFLFFIICSLNFAQTKHQKISNRSKPARIKNEKEKESLEKPKIFDFNGNLISEEKAKKLLAGMDVQPVNIFENGKLRAVKLSKNEAIGKQSSDFTFNLIDESVIAFSGQAGKITVLNFWYVGCKPCMAEIPLLNKIVEKYKDSKDVDFFAVTFIAPEDVNGISNLKSFLEKNKFDFQIAVATKSVLDAFKIRAYPQTIVIDKEGKIIFWRLSLGNDAEPLNEIIDDELNK
ncbi:MAG: TlpA family protein disulfide reductase [Pyrinomonadaceae bacterium]